MTERELFDALLTLCQTYGYTNVATRDHLRRAIDSIEQEDYS